MGPRSCQALLLLLGTGALPMEHAVVLLPRQKVLARRPSARGLAAVSAVERVLPR